MKVKNILRTIILFEKKIKIKLTKADINYTNKKETVAFFDGIRHQEEFNNKKDRNEVINVINKLD